ncbi:MAG: spondin domain-containing protein, partial [Bacteroidota bacterium]
KKLLIFIILPLTFFTISCDDDDDVDNPPPATPTSFTVSIENISTPYTYAASGIFNTPDGDTAPGPIGPDASYSFSFYAGPSVTPGTDTKLSFALMLIASNDLFFGPLEDGIDLYDDNGTALTGDITNQVFLWDAGTEVNQEPGTGANQPMNGTGGTDENGNVTLIADGMQDAGGFTYPNVSDLIKVTIENPEPSKFTVKIKNVSGASTLSGPHSPGVWVVHTASEPLFDQDAPDFGNGLEVIAEDGNPASLGEFLGNDSGFTLPLSPGAWAVHTQGAKPLFTDGAPDSEGIEGIAEDGNPANLIASLTANNEVLSSAVFNTPAGANMPGAIGPGGSYEFTINAVPGDYFNFATMYIQSNDLFFAFDDTGIPLWDSNGNPISGDMTDKVQLWDGGTEVNEFPGAGLNQAIRQSGPDTGMDEGGNVRLEDDEFAHRAVGDVIRVTISPQS